ITRDERCDVGENDRSCGAAGTCEENRIPLGVEPLLEFPDSLTVVESLPVPAYGNRKLVPDRCAAVNAESAERCHPEVEPAETLAARPEHHLDQDEAHDAGRCICGVAHEISFDLFLSPREPGVGESNDASILPCDRYRVARYVIVAEGTQRKRLLACLFLSEPFV